MQNPWQYGKSVAIWAYLVQNMGYISAKSGANMDYHPNKQPITPVSAGWFYILYPTQINLWYCLTKAAGPDPPGPWWLWCVHQLSGSFLDISNLQTKATLHHAFTPSLPLSCIDLRLHCTCKQHGRGSHNHIWQPTALLCLLPFCFRANMCQSLAAVLVQRLLRFNVCFMADASKPTTLFWLQSGWLHSSKQHKLPP